MRRRTIFSLFAAVGLSACAHQTTPAVVAPEMAWSLSSAEGEGAKLAFGQPQSDNVLLILSCQPASGQVVVSMNAPTEASRPTVRLSSGGKALRLSGETAPSGLGGTIVETVAGAGDPVFDSFARSGELAVAVGARRTQLPAADRAQISRFVETCRPA